MLFRSLLRSTLALLGGTAGSAAVENSQVVMMLATVLANHGRFAEASDLLKGVVGPMGRHLGPRHPAALAAAALLERIHGEMATRDAAAEDP